MKKGYYFIITLFLLSEAAVYGQLGFELAGGSRNIATGGSAVAMKGIAGIYGNQANIISADGWAFTGTVLRRYNITDLDMIMAAAVYGRENTAWGISVVQYGYDSYKEQKMGLAYARKLNAKVNIGMQLNAIALHLGNFGSQTYFTFEGGIMADISDQVSLGFHTFSPAKVGINAIDDIPSRLSIGPRITISDEVTTYLEFEKISGYNPSFAAGVLYQIEENFSTLIGINPVLSEFSFGFTYNFSGNYHLDSGYGYHQTLGVTPAITFRKEKYKQH